MVTLIFKVFVDLWGSENAFSDYCPGNSLQFELFSHFDIQGTRNSVLFTAVERGDFPRSSNLLGVPI